jgi:hypothetical protein
MDAAALGIDALALALPFVPAVGAVFTKAKIAAEGVAGCGVLLRKATLNFELPPMRSRRRSSDTELIRARSRQS